MGTKSKKTDPTKCDLLSEFTIGNTVADIGCATGFYTEYLEKRGKQVIGIDIKRELLSFAKNDNNIVGSITSLPLKNNSIDTSVMFDLLEHVEEDCIKEVKRVTKKRIIITVPRTTNRELLDNWLLFGHHLDQTRKRTYTIKSSNNLLRRYRMNKVAIKPIHPISTEALLFDILKGPTLKRKIARKIALSLCKPKIFFSNLAIIADLA